MNKSILTTMFIACMVSLLYCKTGKNISQPTGDNSRNSLDWDGIYMGVVPCADCQGLQTTVYLNKDQTYYLKTKHLGRAVPMKAYSGSFRWNSQGNTITLNNLAKGMSRNYLVGENTITQVINDKKITGDLAVRYVLSKDNYAIVERYWKLIELNGKPVMVDSTFPREPYIIFKVEDGRFIGNGGCNNFSGSYELKGMNRISLSNSMTTQMACPKLAIESEYLKVLVETDNFNLAGDILVLNKARMAPLARFKSVLMQ